VPERSAVLAYHFRTGFVVMITNYTIEFISTEKFITSAWSRDVSFSEGDCTSSQGWPLGVHRASERGVSEALCTKRREWVEALKSSLHESSCCPLNDHLSAKSGSVRQYA
jgi:hypothetical protein